MQDVHIYRDTQPARLNTLGIVLGRFQGLYGWYLYENPLILALETVWLFKYQRSMG